MKSNITISSNVYVRSHEYIHQDPKYVSQVSGKPALTKLSKEFFGSNSGIRLLDWQNKMLSNDVKCALARNGEMTHGLVKKNGDLVWEGRCENKSCDRYSYCTETAQYNRNKQLLAKAPSILRPSLAFEWLGDIIDILAIDETPDEVPEEIVPPEAMIESIGEFVAIDNYIALDNPEPIITAAIDSKILVNAGPGSGKTYTVIRRLEYIIQHQAVLDFSSVLVLVYTHAAKSEIVARIEAGISAGRLPYTAKSIDICTFDSLATSYLAAIDLSFTQLDYNERIQLFNQMFKKENFTNFEYVIIDELQDLVNERAWMTLNILSAIPGGYLLLGDKCQAIYDYDCHESNNMNSVDFYTKLEELLPPNAQKYELLGNKRQSVELTSFSNDLRTALLSFSAQEANEFLEDEIRKIETAGSLKKIDFSHITSKTAILCRNNGEAEYVSHHLHKAGIPHNLLRSIGANLSLKRWIADCLWDYRADSRITRIAFIDRYCVRVNDDAEVASSLFDSLSEAAYGDVKEHIEIGKLSSSLSKSSGNLSPLLHNEHDKLLTVSTIHKAKGREFDTVYLMDSNFKIDPNNTEEARVWYVGCTRSKSQLYRIERCNAFLKRSRGNMYRWSAWVRKWNTSKFTYCKGSVIGLPMDVSPTGYVSGDLQRALDTQQYIAESIQIGDVISIYLQDDKYMLDHKGKDIGCLSAGIARELLNLVREKNYYSGQPPYFSPLFITNIVTITPLEFPDGVPLFFRESQFWLGLEISGFPKIDWHYERKDS